jgi:hypothetical protein
MARKEDGSKPWNPYLAGALSGLLLVASVWVAGKYFGASTSFVRSAGMIEQVFDCQVHALYQVCPVIDS